MAAEKVCGASLDGVALLDQAAPLRQHQAKHPQRIRVGRHGQAHGSL
jgi:hypothetical protein